LYRLSAGALRNADAENPGPTKVTAADAEGRTYV
jgi:hypothetical protein